MRRVLIRETINPLHRPTIVGIVVLRLLFPLPWFNPQGLGETANGSRTCRIDQCIASIFRLHLFRVAGEVIEDDIDQVLWDW